jgi:hypothetical protein
MAPLALIAVSVAAADARPELSTGQVDAPLEALASPSAWPQEERRWHFGVGYRGHLGMMESQGAAFLVAQSELVGLFTLRVDPHHELRVELGLAAGYPDTFAGESNISFRWALNQRVYLGIGVLGFWGFWSMRAGLELPLAIRLDRRRRHELTFALRTTLGVYNNDTFVWWDFAMQRLAVAGDVVLGYSFLF